MAREARYAQGEGLSAAGEVVLSGETLRTSEERFRQEFGTAPFGIIATGLAPDRPHVYLAANDTFCRLTGYSRRELVGADFLGDVHPEEQPAIEALVGEIISGAASEIHTDTRLIRRDGSAVHVRLTGSVIQSPAGARYLAAYLEDITEAGQAQAEIRRLEREMQRLRRRDSLGHLADGIAHDFTDMLTVITNFASLVRDEIVIAEATDSGSRWGPVRWDVEQIEDAADRAKRLIRHVLAVAQCEPAPAAPVDVGQLITDAAGLLREVLGEHIQVVTRHAAGLWPVETDPGQLEQAIVNLTLNARDAMPHGGQVRIDTANVDTADTGTVPSRAGPGQPAELPPGQYVEMRCSDTGVGMDPATAERAFEPFFSTKPGDQAAGLGLPAVRRIAAQAGGAAWLRSAPGQGTSVTIMLPAARGSAAGETAARQAGGKPEHAGTVLVVDDEAAIRDVVHRVLTSAGYQVKTAASAQQALAILADPATPADLLLTDVVTPGAGEPFADRAREICPGIRILFTSGYGRQGGAASWPLAAGQVLTKPFSRAALLDQVSQALVLPANRGDWPDRP